ncbi:MAG: CapA family protein [Minisyncoccota bacterium]
MEWITGIIAAVIAFFLSVLPSFGEELRYRMTTPSSILRPEATVLFGGDMMFDRTIREAMKKHGDDHVFSCLGDALKTPDLVVANLEGPITDNPSTSVGSTPGDMYNFTFTFPTSTATLLARHNIRLVNLGNNHIMNFSRDGLLQTKRYLAEAGVEYFGDPDSVEEDRVARLNIRGVPISFVNWSDWTSDKTDHTVAQVRKEAESGHVVVVYTHWGEEYVPATERMKVLARQFVDAGAAIVIGSHPHVVQEHEEYNGKHIYYSLGNFVFDQYWNDDVRTGLLLRVALGRGGVTAIEEVPVYLERDRTTCILKESTEMLRPDG